VPSFGNIATADRACKPVSAQGRHDAVDAANRLFAVALRHNEHELIARVACDNVALARIFLQHLRETFEREIAKAVSPRVVDLLEIVEIQNDEREGVS